jgi:ATP-dependent exoDNAse (exonuclease V) beta subunit
VYPSEPAALVALTQRIRRQILDEGLAAVLNGWRQALAPEADGRNLDRLGALVEQALTYAGDPLDLAGFRRQAERLGVEDLSPARVRIITIHASKGREFDAVILPDLDGAFNRRSPTLLTHRAEITAPFDQVTRTPDEAVRALVPELDALYIAQRQRAVVEELCGLYVAMTRAKTTLEMIVQPSTARKDGSTALPASMAGVLRGALVPESPEAPPETCLWQTGSEVAAPSTARPVTPSTQPSGAAPAATPAPAVSVRLALRPAGAGGSLRLRPVVSPSSLEGGGIINLTGALTLGTAKTLDRGSALHRLFECVGWADDPAPDESTLRAALAGLGLPETTAAATPHAAADYLAAFKTALAQPALRAALGRARHRGTSEQVPTLELWRERRFAVPLRDPVSMAWVTVQGQVDRVVVVRGPAAAGDKTPGRVLRALVQDFKSDRLENTGPALREKVEYYRPQLQTYCRAVAALLGIDPGLVAAELLFVTAGVVAPV